ncbi:Influenza virus NS1A-binding protein homolog [Eumeta japonica]|uniref:Influenza virus NS1A-binding protein homolog n=1 Tax=Eumeta variegata TaxID=151549 RepID=A0A4C1UAE4_EUMVA|nr:Influenza virus NS1A-binding protein homolog [Eumeta japonica]
MVKHYGDIERRVTAGNKANVALFAAMCSTDQWSPIAAMRTARKNFGLAALEGCLYAFGGEGAAGVLSSVEVYDPEADEWAPAGNMPHARCEMGVVAYNGELAKLAITCFEVKLL